jgi:hypothetical protein
VNSAAGFANILLEVFDGSTEVALRLTVSPEAPICSGSHLLA